MYFPPDFDLICSIELARLVTQAYDQFDSYQRGVRWTPKDGYTLVKELSQETFAGRIGKTGTQFDVEMRMLERARASVGKAYPIGFIAQKGKNIFIIFRGTVTLEEWVRNLNVRLSGYLVQGCGKVHDGFLHTYGIIRKRLLEVLMQLDPRNRLYATGHSLGAALATLALPDIMANTRFKNAVLYTFGSPRVGDRDFAQVFGAMFVNRSFRIANTSDVVVSLPLPVPILGIIGGNFTHVDTPVDFTVQEDDLERNHVIGTYLSALLSAAGDRRIMRRIFGRRLASR
jgi:triacylglycerol lipase